MTSTTYGLMQSNENQVLSPELEEQCLHFLSKNMWGMLCELLKKNDTDKEAIVKFMDSLLDGEYEANVLRRHPDLHFKDTRSIIKKWLWKILKMHKFPNGICPNLLSSHRMGFISHTFHQYQRQQTSHYNWRELVLHTAGNCKRTQRRVINMLLGLGMIQEAARFADDFDFDEDDFSCELQQERRRYRLNPREDLVELLWSPADELDKGDTENIANPFHTFLYPRPAIKILSNKQQFLTCVSHLSQPGSVVGVDTEWQTLFDSATDKDCIALVQLATSDIVYILDVITLMPILSPDDWIYFFHQVFCNDSVIKLGYGLSQDFKILKHTFPYISTEQFVQIIDLQTTMDKKICGQNRKDSKDVTRKRRHKGLSGLTEDYLCKPLDKTYQVSCWSKRPLLKAQVLYAALDAFVLLQLYEIALQRNIDLSNTDQSLSTSDKKLPDGMDSDDKMDMESRGCDNETVSCDFGRSHNSSPSSHSSGQHQQVPAISPHDLRVIVDTMLQGLGWSLRSVGVDTLILKSGQSHKDAIALALRENRIVLTSGKIFQMFSARLGEDKCYCVANNKAKKQLQDVLQHFNVRVQKQDILSRCQLCNSKTFILVESDKMRTLKEVKSQQQKFLPIDKGWSSNPNGLGSPEFISDPDVSACLPMMEDVSARSGPILEDDHFIDMDTAVFCKSGVSIQLEYIPDCLFDQNKLFYCCVSCGKVYWDGCHHERVINALNGLIPLHNDNEQDPSIYDILQANTHSTDPPVSN